MQQEIAAAVQGALTNALNGQREGIRSDLREFRDEMRGEMTGLRHDVSELKVGMAQGDGMFKLMGQRMTWLEDENERREHADQERSRTGMMGDTTRISKALAEANKAEANKAKDKTSDDSGKRRKDDDKDRLLINPKVINAFILAFTAAAGASLWAFLEHTFAATPPPPAVSTPTPVTPSTHSTTGTGP